MYGPPLFDRSAPITISASLSVQHRSTLLEVDPSAGAIVLTLPSGSGAVGMGWWCALADVAGACDPTKTITIRCPAGATIRGASDLVLSSPWVSAWVYYRGNGKWITL